MEFLFDDEWVDLAAGVRRVPGVPEKAPEPILRPDRPWEGEYVHGHVGPFFDPAVDKYRLYYRSRCAGYTGATVSDPDATVPGPPKVSTRTFVCLAESEDGERWRKPPLGLFEFEGTTANNIILEGTGADSAYWNVVYDADEADPERRYKALGFDHCTHTLLEDTTPGSMGVCVDYSPDGLHWRGRRDLVMSTRDLTDADCMLPFREPTTGRWVAFFRPRVAPKRRFLGCSTSDDFEHWSYPRMLLTPDTTDDAFIEFYGLAATALATFRVGALWVYHNNPNYSPMTTELVYSRDGRNYRRAIPGAPFLPLGEDADFDCRMIVVNGILECDGEHRIYYTGHNVEHGSDHGRPMQRDREPVGGRRRSGIGMARLPWGRFCGLHAEYNGVVETKWLCNYGRRGVRILADCGPAGRVRAEILDQYGKVIPGWNAGCSVTRPEEGGWSSLSWGSGLTGAAGQHSAEGGIVGHVAKLRFYLDRATLYGFDVGDEDATPQAT